MRVFLFVSLIGLVCATAEAKPRNRYYSNTQSMPIISSYTTQSMPTVRSYTQSMPTVANNSTAQGVAEMMAQRNYVGHFGGNSGYEGCGSGSTPEQAYRNCCFANSGMATVDVGYAQSRDGRWFCCRRYR